MAREYVPIFFEWLEVTQDLSQEGKGNLIDAAVLYASGGDYESVLKGEERIAFRFIKGQIDRNNAISDIRSRARANKINQPETNDNKTEENGTNDNKQYQTESKLPKEKEKEKEKDKDKKSFTPPTLEEVTAYCRERNNGIDPQHFIDYYEARGWELKPKQKVKDWKACIRTWEQNDKKGSKKVRVLPAANFPQRDYSTVDDEIMSDLARDMRAFKEGGGA